MKTKNIKAIVSESRHINVCRITSVPIPIPIIKENMDFFVDRLKQFIVNEVFPKTDKYGCSDKIMCFIQREPLPYMTAKFDIFDDDCNSTYIDIYIPVTVDGIEVPYDALCNKIRDMIKTDCRGIYVGEVES